MARLRARYRSVRAIRATRTVRGFSEEVDTAREVSWYPRASREVRSVVRGRHGGLGSRGSECWVGWNKIGWISYASVVRNKRRIWPTNRILAAICTSGAVGKEQKIKTSRRSGGVCHRRVQPATLHSRSHFSNDGCPPPRLLSHRLQGSWRPDPRLQGRGSRRRRWHRPALRPPHEDGASPFPPVSLPKPSEGTDGRSAPISPPGLTYHTARHPPQNPLVTELSLYDIAGTPGVAADVSHVNTAAQTKVRAPI